MPAPGPATTADASPPPPLHRFGSFPEEEEVQLFALRGTPLLRVGSRIHALGSDQAKREPGLEKVLLDDAGKPWWRVLAGAYPGDLVADRVVVAPGSAGPGEPRVEVVRVTEAGPRIVGALRRPAGPVQHLTPLPDGRVLVTSQAGDGVESEIVPAAAADERILASCVFPGEAVRSGDGSVTLACADRRGGPSSLVTFRPGAAPTVEPMVGLDNAYLSLFTAPDGVLHASDLGRGDLHARVARGWVKVERGAPGSAAEARLLQLQHRRPGGRVPVDLVHRGRRLQVDATGLARDAGGGWWALAESGLGLFHDRAPPSVVELAPPRQATGARPADLPPAARASASDPDAPLVEVLDASRHLAEGGGGLRIHPLVGRTFVSVDERLLYVDGDTLRSDPLLQRGLEDRAPPGWGREVLGAMGGRFPESAWLPITDLGERGNSVKILRWSASGWTQALSDSGGMKADRVHPLAGGWSILQSLQGGFAYSYGPGLHLSLLHDDVPRMVAGAGLAGLGDGSEPRAVVTLADGTLLVALADAVAAWSPGGEPLPMAPLPAGAAPYGLVARSISEVHVLVHPTKVPLDASGPAHHDAMAEEAAPDPAAQRILRYDGATWSTEVLPARTARLRGLRLGPRGSLWVMLEKSPELLVRSSSGAWTTRRAPAPVDDLWAGPEGDVWAVSGSRLLHTRPLPRGFDLGAILPPPGIEEWGPSCASVAVLVHDVPRTAPASLSHAATIGLLAPSLGELADRAAYLEITTPAGARALVLHLDDPASWSADAARVVASATAAMRVAEARIAGARPRLVCLRSVDPSAPPRGVRSLRHVGGRPPGQATSR
jgi:hypothetical protein